MDSFEMVKHHSYLVRHCNINKNPLYPHTVHKNLVLHMPIDAHVTPGWYTHEIVTVHLQIGFHTIVCNVSFYEYGLEQPWAYPHSPRLAPVRNSNSPPELVL
jgi:hypothetical protein